MARNLKVSHGTDKIRRYNLKGKVEPFTKAEQEQLILQPLRECQSIEEFLELAEWCAEDEKILEMLYLICYRNALVEYVKELEHWYDCSCA